MKRHHESIVALVSIAVFLVIVKFFPLVSRAGNLEPPPGPIGPTMRTLDEIYEKLETIDGKLEPLPCEGTLVPKTGQITSYYAGDDGALERGAAYPVPRFTDNENGTVTDNLTGLIWLRRGNPFGLLNWKDACNACNMLADGGQGLTDGSQEGDWRLPNIRELHSLIDFSYHYPAICNTSGSGKWQRGDPFSIVNNWWYWSSTTNVHDPENAWQVNTSDGSVSDYNKSNESWLWCVRGGQ